MSLKQKLMKQSSSPDFWGGPLWRRILVAVIGLIALGVWILVVERWLT